MIVEAQGSEEVVAVVDVEFAELHLFAEDWLMNPLEERRYWPGHCWQQILLAMIAGHFAKMVRTGTDMLMKYPLLH